MVAIFPVGSVEGNYQVENASRALWAAVKNTRDPDWDTLDISDQLNWRRYTQAVFDWLVNPYLNPHVHRDDK